MNHCHSSGNRYPRHTNGFILLNGVPYAYGDYLDRNTFRQVDQSTIKNEVQVDNCEAMRSMVHIYVNNVCRRLTDSTLTVEGNKAKQQRLLRSIVDMMPQMHGHLDVLRKGLVVRIFYSVENLRTGQILRTASEDLRISNGSCFLHIDPHHVDDTAILVNFEDTMASTINEFAHGRDRMTLRIRSMHMFYECAVRDRKPHQPGRPIAPPPLPDHYGREGQYYNFHRAMQSQQMIDGDAITWMDHMCHGADGYGAFGHEDITPPKWGCMTHFYHFDNGGRDLIIHLPELMDPRTETILIPCGEVKINRTFEVNPGHRIIYHFCVWKNELAVVNDTTAIANAMGAHTDDYCCDMDHWPMQPPCPPPNGAPPDDSVNPDYETLMRMMHDSMRTIQKQSHTINHLVCQVNKMNDVLDTIRKPDDEPTYPGFDDAAAVIAGTPFNTLQDAINAVQDGTVKGEIVLAADVEECLVITGDVTIDLNGHTVRAARREDTKPFYHTFMVDGGNLVINGEGTVENVNTQGYCVINLGEDDTWTPEKTPAQGLGQGTVTLNGGTYIHATADATHNGYVIVNRGTMMTINEGVIVDTKLDDSSLVTNGFMADPPAHSSMVINGGHFRGGRHTVNNDHGGRLRINGGKFKMGAPWIGMEYKKGPKNVLRNEEDSIAVIRGGEFTGNVENSSTMENSLRIFGGKFNVDVKEYLPEGYSQTMDGTVLPPDAQ